MDRHLILITGSNRGFGRSIVNLLINHYEKKENHVDLYLISRNGEFEVEVTNTDIKVHHWKVDFAIKEDWAQLSEKINDLSLDYKVVKVFSNAGCLGSLDVVERIDMESIELATRVNYLGPVSFISGIINRFNYSDAVLYLVNISSLAAIQPFRGWSTYCSTKAAASLFFKCIATEKDPKKVRVLNYAPGPLDTRMQTEIRNGMKGELESDAKFWADLKENNGLIDPDQSASVLIDILEENQFESGVHVDFYDIKK